MMRALSARYGLVLAAAFGAADVGRAQTPLPIRDNSFLIEEAYNQEWGVVQHVGTFQRVRGTRGWGATFTQEWPVPHERHQLSYTIPLDRSGGGDMDVGQVALNYRYQIAMRAGSPLAVAPRLSIVKQLGSTSAPEHNNSLAAEVNLPVSIELSRSLVTHFNVGANWIRSGGALSSPSESFVGQSLIFLVHPKFNLMVESLFTVEGGARTLLEEDEDRSFYVAPGFRGAIDFPSGLQIVPGIAFPIGVGPSKGEEGIYLYVSFEHPFRRR